jgi:putative membrane protein
MQNELILRDKLALDRTILANQRTLLSYIKTGIFFISTAVGIFYLEKKQAFSLIEWALCLVGLLAIIIGLVVYLKMRKKINHLYQ